MQSTRFFMFASSILLAACASSVEGDLDPRGISVFKNDARLGDSVNSICFGRKIDGFSSNTRDTVVLSAGASKDYLVSVRGSCRSLRNAKSIAIDSGVSCVSKNDILIVSESFFSLNDGGFGPDRCFIDEIYKWDKRAKDAAPEMTEG